MFQTLAIVIVTYNRCELLKKGLHSLEQQTYPIDTVIVVNNASTDGLTQDYLDNYQGDLPLFILHNTTNTGGAGGFYTGIKTAYEQGYDWVFVMDDDVVADPNCLKNLMKIANPCMMVVREDKLGNLVERSVTSYHLKNPFKPNPKGKMLCEIYQTRSQMPMTLPVVSGAFEGFMVQREVINKIGLPEPKYFILYDDLDYILRARQAGFITLAVRDAKVIRQLAFNETDAITTWKGFYAFRNFFHIHEKFGKNWLVKKKPYLLAVIAICVYGIKYQRLSIIKNIYHALKTYKTLDK